MNKRGQSEGMLVTLEELFGGYGHPMDRAVRIIN